MQDLEGDLGLVLGVESEFADGFAEVGKRSVARATGRLNTGSGRTFGMLNQNSRERSEFRFR